MAPNPQIFLGVATCDVKVRSLCFSAIPLHASTVIMEAEESESDRSSVATAWF